MRQPKTPPSFAISLAEEMKTDPNFLFRFSESEIRELIARSNNEGWNWEDSSYRARLAGLTARQLWLLIKMSRTTDRRAVALTDKAGRPFTYRLPPAAHRVLHLIDTNLGGTIGAAIPQLNTEDEQKRYLLTALREEAIASSQIEGAAVTREVAKEMLRTARKPRTKDERMILNNYQTILMLNRQRKQALTTELLCEVQRSLTDGTFDEPEAVGRFRTADENILVWDDEDGEPLHVPPVADELAERIQKLCDFANAEVIASDKNEFIHPAIRAILLHFWLAYDHPFVDGNGRTARALFYWSMLRDGYWLAEYLTISTIIKGQQKQYARAYLNTELDDNDLTYFILYHLGVIERSIIAFREYLDRKTSEQREHVQLLAGPFNSRQRALLLLAIRNPAARFTYESHARSHGVTVPTARADLLHLEKLGLLKGNRAGRHFEFSPVAGMEERLRHIGTTT
jgi:Fic family protein